MVVKTEGKRHRTAAQMANDERLRQKWTLPQDTAERESEPVLPVRRQGAQPPNGRQTFLARNGRLQRHSMENATELETRGDQSPARRGHVAAGVITVEHVTDQPVKMWKRGPYGWVPRHVPANTIKTNLDNGWMEYCPDCGGTDCSDDPNTCPGKTTRRFIVCPVPACNGDGAGPKRIFATGFGAPLEERPEDANEIPSPYASYSVENELRAKMDMHLMTFHQEEARMLGLFGQAAPPVRIGGGIQMAEQQRPE